MPATIIGIATHKGGTSKTATSESLRAGLARAGKRTLLVECDPQAQSSKALNIETMDSDPSLQELLADLRSSIASVIKQTQIENRRVIPSTIRLERQAQAFYTRPNREELLKQALSSLLAGSTSSSS